MSTRSHQDTRIAGSDDLSNIYDRFGKADFLASLVGMFAGLGTLTFLAALLAAGAGSVDFQLNQINVDGGLDEASVIGLVVGAAVVFVSFLVGGFAAGRMARYAGGINGLGAGLWALLLVAVFGALGAWVGVEYNAFNQPGLPNWVAQLDVDDLTAEVIMATVVMMAVTLFGGYTGGRMGALYHQKVDAAIVQTVESHRVDSDRKEA